MPKLALDVTSVSCGKRGNFWLLFSRASDAGNAGDGFTGLRLILRCAMSPSHDV